MSKSLYGHHVVLKYLHYGTDTQKDLVKKSLFGHVCKLARHSVRILFALICHSNCSLVCCRSAVECWNIATTIFAIQLNGFNSFRNSTDENMRL